MSWYKVTISAHQPDFFQPGKLQDKFEELFIRLLEPDDMALLNPLQWPNSSHAPPSYTESQFETEIIAESG